MNTITRKDRVGVYAWAGPGTIRLLETKYFSPQINTDSFLEAYDLPYLTKLKDTFGVTDAWISYSWGFSDTTEQQDYLYLQERLSHFKKVGIRTHAYIQGLNLVTSEFTDSDPWCRDPWGHTIPYSKGRSFTCPNNPQAVAFIMSRVKRAAKENVDGIYVDNILFGLPPFAVFSDFLPFFGCSCMHCQKAFLTQFGYPLPLFEKRGKQVADYLSFRSQSVQKLIETVAAVAKSHEKEFGINLYDPTLRLDTVYYGYDVQKILPSLDYLMIENHSLPGKDTNNCHLRKLLQESHKPIFVVSYKEGIGYEDQYTQEDIDRIFSESKTLGYNPCLKVTEFTTNGIWHMLDLSKLLVPKKIKYKNKRSLPQEKGSLRSSSFQRYVTRLLQYWVIQCIYASICNRFIHNIVESFGIYRNEVRKPRITKLTN